VQPEGDRGLRPPSLQRIGEAASGRHARAQRTPGGYAFTLAGKTLSLTEAAEWIGLERRCCPFLTFGLSASGDRSDWLLTLTGPEGVKALFEAEFRPPTDRQ
jgi:hypothetical protein